MSSGCPESTSHGCPLDVRLERPLDAISRHPQDARSGRLGDVISGPLRDGQIGSSGEVLWTLEEDIPKTSWRPILAGLELACVILQLILGLT